MSITARHKNPDAFKKLVESLETTPPEKRAKILDVMKTEDAKFVERIEACIFKFEEFGAMGDMLICEIVASLDAEIRTLALALYRCKDEALYAKFTKNMPPKLFSAFKEATSELTEVRQFQQVSAQYRYIQKARMLEAEGKIQLKAAKLVA